MGTLKTLSILLTLAQLGACGHPNSRGEGDRKRGSAEFKKNLLLGIGASRPAPLEGAGQLGLAAQQDGIVQLTMDPVSFTWGWVTFDTQRVPLIADASELEEWSRQYISSRTTELGIRMGELLAFDRTSYEPLAGTHMLTFRRQFDGIPIKGAFTQLVFAHEAGSGYRLREIINNSYGEVELQGEKEAPSAQQAIAATGVPSLNWRESQPLIHVSLNAQGNYVFRQATEFTLEDKEEGEQFRVTLDNDTMDILEASSNHLEARHEIQLNTYTRSYVLKDEKPRPFPDFSLVLPAGSAPVEADKQGILNTDATAVTVSLVGSKSATGVVNFATNPDSFYSFPLTLPAAGGLTTVNLTQADPASVNAYLAVHEVNEFAKNFLDPARIPLLTQGIQANVNLTDQQNLFCNAFFDGQTLNFFRAGNGCGNTALINDVVFHEWGHALDNAVGVMTNPNGITDGAFSEGLGDIIASYMTGFPAVGVGFGLNDANSIVRNVQNTRRHPPANEQEAQVHSAGQIIGGAFWDLRVGLVRMLGPVEGGRKAADIFFKHMTMTDRYIDSYQSVLRLDDADNNPATRSPLYCTINRAFAAHNLTAGLTEGDNCVDPDQALRVRVDVDKGGGQLNLVASSWGASSIEACSGKVPACTTTSPGFVAFVGDGKSPKFLAPSGKKLFEASSDLVVKAGEPITFVSRDAVGKVIGTKTLSFKPRDQTADLSRKAP